MYGNRTGAISRSFHAPHGVNINAAAAKQPGKVKRKNSWANSRIRSALSEGGLAPRPVMLKEGYLNKPSFFRFTGRKRRWCVVRTYSQTEAAIDVYLDEAKSRYKGSITLDKDMNPILVVKNTDGKRSRKGKNGYFSIKVGKRSYSFTANTFPELKEWCSLVRQAMDNGSIFSGRVTEPKSLDEGMVNVKFNSNCIALLCPLKEIPIKTWRLDHITSFGQCGGTLTFECCPSCSDPGTARCSINMVQEKPSTILNIMERAIRSNPNTAEIHYERSILGDIYHCSHDCCQPRLLPAYSDPQLFRSSTASPMKGMGNFAPVDPHGDFDYPPSCAMESTDSGLPGTPQAEESLSIASSIPSPTGSSKSNHGFKLSSPFRSPKHSIHDVHKGRSMSDSKTAGQNGDSKMYQRRQSDELPQTSGQPSMEYRKMSDGQIQQHHPRLTYATISHDSSPKLVRKELKATVSTPGESPVMYSSVQTDDMHRERRATYNRLQPVDEYDVIYDVPNCEPGSNPFSPPMTPSHRPRRDSKTSSSGGSQNESPVHRTPKLSVQSTMSSISCYLPGSDTHDRNEDYEDIPPVPIHRGRRNHHNPQVHRSPVKEPARRNGVSMMPQPRRRLQSSSEILDSSSSRYAHSYNMQKARMRGSMDNLDQLGHNERNHTTSSAFTPAYDRQLKGSTDLLRRLQEEDERLKQVLQGSKKEKNEEIPEVPEMRRDLGRPYNKFNMDDIEYDEPDPDMLLETSSNLLEYRGHVYSRPPSNDRVLTKVASDTVRGYAYKIAIPVANRQYDVPRRIAPTPDLANMRHDAPPKPMRYTSTEHLYFAS